MKDRIAIKLAGEFFRQSDIYSLSPDKLAELLESLSAGQIEGIADICIRDRVGEEDTEYKRLQEYMRHLNHLLRPFAFATQDDSIAECEKLFSIFYRNYVFMRRFIKDSGIKEKYDEYCDSWHYKDKL